jgi:hypothetical protein
MNLLAIKKRLTIACQPLLLRVAGGVRRGGVKNCILFLFRGCPDRPAVSNLIRGAVWTKLSLKIEISITL